MKPLRAIIHLAIVAPIVALQAVERTKLIRHFTFNEGLMESVYNNEPSILIGNPSLVDGISGQAVHLNGQSALIYDDYFDLNVETFTLSAWINPDVQEQLAVIVNRGLNNYWMFFNHGEIKSGFYDHDYREIFSATYLPPNEWHFIAVTYDGKALRMYIDHHLHWIKKVESKPRQIKEPLVIGAQPGSSLRHFFRGSIDEVRLYEGALSKAEVVKLFNQYKAD